jgi:hypothetical protein
VKTTLTIADDVATQLDRLCAARKARREDVINEALRAGLKRMSLPKPPEAPFRTKSVDLGQCLIGSIDDVAEVLELAEEQTGLPGSDTIVGD